MKKQISDRKKQANRNNAARSTGPLTPAGKNKSRFNAVRHGLTAQVLLTRGENEDDFREYFRRVREDLRPKGFLEEVRVEDAVVAGWRLRRGVLYEKAWVDRQLKDAKTAIDRNAAALPEKETLELVSRYDTKHRNDRDRALKELERLQDRRKREARERQRRELHENLAPHAQANVARLEPRREEEVDQAS